MTPSKRELSGRSDPDLAAALVAGEIDAMDVLFTRYSRLAYSPGLAPATASTEMSTASSASRRPLG
jgi:hypothetical protein